MSEDRKICLIGDDRLKGYVNRTRDGAKQVFYTGNDCRDWDRYKAEGGHKGNVEMHDKADTIYIRPEEQSHYSLLIDGEWWWVDGCNQCNGRPRSGFGYMGECNKHDVCVTCGIHRDDVKDTPWGGRDGWQCKPCAEAEHKAEKQRALAAMPEKEDFYAYDYHGVDEITCPYCAYEMSDSWECADHSDEDHECPRCDNVFKVDAVHSLTFDCNRLEDD